MRRPSCRICVFGGILKNCKIQRMIGKEQKAKEQQANQDAPEHAVGFLPARQSQPVGKQECRDDTQ